MSVKDMRVDGRTVKQDSLESARRWRYVVPSFMLFWILGLGMLWIVVVPPVLYFHHRKKLVAEPGARRGGWLLVLGLWLGAVLTLSLVTGAADFGRAPGAAFAVGAWLGAACLHQVFQRTDARASFHLVMGLLFVGAVQGALTLLAVIAYPSRILSFDLPASSFLKSSAVAPWTRADFAYQTWFGSSALRSDGLMASSAWSGGFACLCLVLLIAAHSSLRAAGMRRVSWFVAVVLTSISLFYSLSRVSNALALAAIVVVFAYSIGSKYLHRVGPVLVSLVMVVVGAFVLASFNFSALLDDQDALRPGSSTARIVSYSEGLEASLDNGPFIAIAGNGIKPFLESQGRGAGSESAYVSLLVRGGLVALSLFVAFLVIRILAAARRGDWITVLLISVLALHAIVEDLDTGTLTILFGLIDFSRIKSLESPADFSGGIRTSHSG